MTITLNRVHSVDLFSYPQLDLNLKDRGLLLLNGDNGAGKSTVFDTILWTMFGETMKPLKSDDVIREDLDHKPIKGKSQGYVNLTVGADVVEVWRYRKHKDHENQMHLFVNGEPLKMGSDKETLHRFEGLTGYDYDTFLRAVVFPQGGSEFIGIGDAAQKGIFDRVFHTERFSEAHGRAKVALKALRDRLLTLGSSKQEVQRQQEQNRAQLSALDDKSKAWEHLHQLSLAAAIQERDKLMATEPKVDQQMQVAAEQLQKELNRVEVVQLSIRRQAVSTKVAQESATMTAIITEQKLIADSIKQMGDLGPDMPPPLPGHADLHELDREHTAAEKSRVEAMAKLAVAESKFQSLHELLTKYDGKCALCGSELTTEQEVRVLGDSRQRYDDLRQQIDALRIAINNISTGLNAIAAKRKQLDMHGKQMALRGLQLQLSELAGKLADATARVRTAQADEQEVAASQQTHSANQSRYTEYVQALQVQQRAVSEYQTKCAEAQAAVTAEHKQQNHYLAQITELNMTFSALGQRMTQIEWALENCRKEVRVKEFWEQGFGNGGMKSLLYSHLIPQFNQRTNEYLKYLADGKFSVRFTSQQELASGETRDKLSCQVLLAEGGGEYRKASGGEQTRIDLAALFAIGDLASSRPDTAIRLRLLDEPFDFLDGHGCMQVTEALNNLVVPSAGTVIVVTHDSRLKSLIPNQLTVEKVQGKSFIRQ